MLLDRKNNILETLKRSSNIEEIKSNTSHKAEDTPTILIEKTYYGHRIGIGTYTFTEVKN